MLYDIDSEHSVKTIHEHPGKGYAGNPGADTIDLQSKPKSKEDVVDDDSPKERSDLSNISRYQLIARLRKLVEISGSDKGPTPQSVKDRVLTLLRSSDESDSSQEAANSGELTPATVLGLQGGHKDTRQADRGGKSIILDAISMGKKGILILSHRGEGHNAGQINSGHRMKQHM